jgi:oxygen-dependent protoporphyrinogen oxidase
MSPVEAHDQTEIADFVVVGGGLAGLAAAQALSDRAVVLLEQAERVGGRVYSEARQQYWLNLGAHMFGGPGTNVGRLVDACGLETRPIQGHLMGIAYGGKIVSGGRVETFPFRLPLSWADRYSFVRMGLRIRHGTKGLLSAMAPREGETPEERRQRVLAYENNRTLRDYIGPLKPEVDAILRAVTERTSASPDHMAAGYGLTSFTNVWTRWSPNRNMVGGSSKLPDALGAKLGNRVRTGARVTTVVSEADAVICTYRWRGRLHRVRARRAILATPSFITREIVSGIPAETASALNQIVYGPFLSAALLTGETTPMPWDGIYAIATPGRSFGVFFNQASALRTGERKPGGSVMLFRGATGAAELIPKSDAAIESAFFADLADLFPDARGIVREVIIKRWPAGAPYARPGRARLQSALERPFGRIVLAGDFLEFPNMEAAVRSGLDAAQRVRMDEASADARPK